MAVASRSIPVVVPRGRPRLSLVERPRRAGTLGLAAAVLVVASFFAVTVLQTHMAERQMRLDRLNSDIVRARNNFDKLRAERARYQSPEYLSERAKAMGMVPGTETKMVEIPVGIAVEVAAGMGKVDSDVVASKESPLDQFGRMKKTVGAAP